MVSIDTYNACVDFPIFDAKSRSLKKAMLSTAGGAIGKNDHNTVVVEALRDINLHLREGDRLLLDEGIGAVDAAFMAKARVRLQELVKRSGILVFASHSNDFLAQLCNTALWIDHGEIRSVGEVSEVVGLYRCRPPRAQSRAAANYSLAPPFLLLQKPPGNPASGSPAPRPHSVPPSSWSSPARPGNRAQRPPPRAG